MQLRPTRIAAVASAIIITLALSVGVASAMGELGALAESSSATDGLGSTATEWSGATYNADRHVLLTVDDESKAYEFALTADGSINRSVPVRTISLEFGGVRRDFEGLAWMSGETYAFLSEESGEAIIATVPAPSTNGTTTVRSTNIVSTFDASPHSYSTNLGPEGLALDTAGFYVTNELPARLNKFSLAGTFVGSVDLPALADASGVAALADGTYLVISHESRLVARYSIDWASETATLVESRRADGFTQLEGIAVIGSTDVHLFGENTSAAGRPGQTYAHLVGELVPPNYSASDVDCSGDVTIADTMVIAQIQAGNISPSGRACGGGDVNGDGRVDVIDAMLIAQCQVGITNVSCPADAPR